MSAKTTGVGDVLTVGFATTVCMWTCGFFTHQPGFAAPSVIVFFGMLVLLLAGGVAAGRFSNRGWIAGLGSGLVAGLLNLLILGSVIGQNIASGDLVTAVVWVPTAIVISMGLGGIGAALGTLWRRGRTTAVNWPFAFSLVTIVATTVLLSVGGMVTGYEAGLAVPDWPNTEGYNMFLYPLSKMTGGIYFEHAHRLLGSLVGLTTLTLMIYLIASRCTPAVRNIAIIAFVMVVAQGIMGGLRVTGRFTLSTEAVDMAPSTALAAAHGVFGQMFFATLAVLATMLTRTWQSDATAFPRRGIGMDRALGWVALATLLVQLVTGALVRHFAMLTTGLVLHVTGAVIVLGLVGLFAVRAWGLNIEEKTRAVRKLGLVLLIVCGAQLLFGLIAFVVILVEQQGAAPQTVQVLLTTLHQTTGALLLGVTASLVAWHYRLLIPLEQQTNSIATATSYSTAGAS